MDRGNRGIVWRGAVVGAAISVVAAAALQFGSTVFRLLESPAGLLTVDVAFSIWAISVSGLWLVTIPALLTGGVAGATLCAIAGRVTWRTN